MNITNYKYNQYKKHLKNKKKDTYYISCKKSHITQLYTNAFKFFLREFRGLVSTLIII